MIVAEAERLSPPGNAKLRSRTWANPAARATLAPDFVGQDGYQISDKSAWKASSLAQGGWQRAGLLEARIERLPGVSGRGTESDPYTGYGATQWLPYVKYVFSGVDADGDSPAYYRDSITVTDGTWGISFEGQGESTVVQGTGTGPVFDLYATGGTNPEMIWRAALKNLRIDGRGTSLHGVRLHRVHDSIIENVTPYNVVTTGLLEEYGVCNTINRLNVTPLYGTTPVVGYHASTVSGAGSDACKRSNFNITACSGDGIQIDAESFDMIFDGGTFGLNGGWGIKIAATAHRIMCIGIDMETNTAGPVQCPADGCIFDMCDDPSGVPASITGPNCIVRGGSMSGAITGAQSVLISPVGTWTYGTGTVVLGTLLDQLPNQIKAPVTILTPDYATAKAIRRRQNNDGTYGFDDGIDFATGDWVLFAVAANVATPVLRASRVTNTISFPNPPTFTSFNFTPVIGAKFNIYDGGAGVRYGVGLNGGQFQIFIPDTANFSINGGGDLQPIGTNQAFAAFWNGSLELGKASLATNATDGFPYIPSCAGTPTGVPTAHTGYSPIVYDRTNKKICVYDGGWLRNPALT